MAGQYLCQPSLGIGQALKDALQGLIELARRVIGIERLHSDRGIGEHALGWTAIRIKRRVAQRDIEVELADIKDLVHYLWAPADYEHNVNK